MWFPLIVCLGVSSWQKWHITPAKLKSHRTKKKGGALLWTAFAESKNTEMRGRRRRERERARESNGKGLLSGELYL